MVSILFQSHLIRHSGKRTAFKDTQRALEHLRHLVSSQALGHSESTQRALGHSDTWRALRHLGTSALKALRHSDTLFSRLHFLYYELITFSETCVVINRFFFFEDQQITHSQISNQLFLLLLAQLETLFKKIGFLSYVYFCQENTVREKVNFSSEKGEFVKIAEKNYLERVAYDC